MVDKIFAAKREKCGKVIGRLDGATMLALGQLLMFVLGVAE
jgi:mRNA-degrading endonuclease toxin of MazEF toxin-antitoxin module